MSLAQSLEHNGPDRYAVQPAERMRFAVQILRRPGSTTTLLASIPLGSEPGRRRLLNHGWQRGAVGQTPYLQRTFGTADEAAASIVEAYAIAYGVVGDGKGWNIVTPALRPRARWREPWIGEEEPGDADGADLALASAADGRPPASLVGSKPGAALLGVATGLLSAWAAVQSFTAGAGWTIEPGVSVGVLVGCVVLSTAVALSGVADGLVRRGGYLWGDSRTVRGATVFSLGAISATAWAIVLIRMFGTPPAP